MASTSLPPNKSPAPWKAAFLDHLGKMASPEFVLSTLQPAPQSSPTPYLPRARYCIYRGMWAELPENKHNTAGKNERVFESEMPTFTTDVRMYKVPELFSSSSGHAASTDQTQGSGGGGPVEAVWWIKEVMTQWRVKGEAFVIAGDIEGEGEESSGVRTVKSQVGSRMRLVKPGQENDWSWSRELEGHFGNCSPAIRGSFKAPPPGRPVSEPYDDKELELGAKVNSLDDPVARRHFRVVVIKPDEVEQLDLSDPKTSRRFCYKYDGSGDWVMKELWP